MPLQVVEWFAGVGGMHAAWPAAKVQAAIDVDRDAAAIYRSNFAADYWIQEITALTPADVLSLSGDLWWMSPPCQPYTRRGKGRDAADPRAAALLHLIDLIRVCQPSMIALENVVGFEISECRSRLLEALAGYQRLEFQLCPTQLGWPNRRPRYYLIASRVGLIDHRRPLPNYQTPLNSLIDPGADRDASLLLARDAQQRWLAGMDRIDDPTAGKPTACFASSYGQSILRSGSYLRLKEPLGGIDRYRRFSPREVALQLGFPADFRLHDNEALDRPATSAAGTELRLPKPSTTKPKVIGTKQQGTIRNSRESKQIPATHTCRATSGVSPRSENGAALNCTGSQSTETAGRRNRRLWRLLGNSLSVPVVRYILSHLPDDLGSQPSPACTGERITQENAVTGWSGCCRSVVCRASRKARRCCDHR